LDFDQFISTNYFLTAQSFLLSTKNAVKHEVKKKKFTFKKWQFSVTPGVLNVLTFAPTAMIK